MIEPMLLNAADAAKLLGISRSFFYECLSSQRIPLKAVRFGKKRLYDVEQIKSFVKSGCNPQWKAEGLKI